MTETGILLLFNQLTEELKSIYRTSLSDDGSTLVVEKKIGNKLVFSISCLDHEVRWTHTGHNYETNNMRIGLITNVDYDANAQLLLFSCGNNEPFLALTTKDIFK